MYLQRACRKSIPCGISECKIIAPERHATQNEKTFAGEWMKGVMNADGIIKQWLLKSTQSLYTVFPQMSSCDNFSLVTVLLPSTSSTLLKSPQSVPYSICVLWLLNTWSIRIMNSCRYYISHQVATHKKSQVTNCWQQYQNVLAVCQPGDTSVQLISLGLVWVCLYIFQLRHQKLWTLAL